MTREKKGRANRSGRIPGILVHGLVVALLGLAVVGAEAVAPAGPGAASGVAHADEPAKKTEKPKVDPASVFYGNARSFHKPAEVDTNSVWAEIEEYKKILEDDIEPGSARYELLMEKASRRFSTAVRKAARAGKYDLVAKTGSVENVADVPDITQDVIDRL